jgi:hypothetical protein
MSSLPVELWNIGILKVVEGSLGKFIDVEDNYNKKEDKREVKILVELYIRQRLPKEIEIVWGN